MLLAFRIPRFEFHVFQEIVIHKESDRLRQVRDRVPDLWQKQLVPWNYQSSLTCTSRADKRTFLRSGAFCPKGIGGGPRGCRLAGLLGPVGFSLREGLTSSFTEFWTITGGGNDSGTVFFVESVSGGPSSESERSQSTETGGWVGSGIRGDEGSGADLVAEGFVLTASSKPPGGPFLFHLPRSLARPLLAP